MSGPYFIVCANPACGSLKQVRRPSEQQRHRFCSRKCAATIVQTLTRAGMRRGGLESASRKRQQLLARLTGLEPIACFRLGYETGLRSKCRQIHQKYTLTRKAVELE